MTQPIPIIGAGIAGLTLGRCLLHRGSPSILYEKASSKTRYNYAITLHASAYRPLLKILGIDEQIFKSRVAVGAESGGTRKIGNDVTLPSYTCLYDTSSSFRANRAKFEQLLREGLDLRWKHTLSSIESSPQGSRLEFNNGESCSAKLVIGADGVHSTVRKLLLPSASPDILPYVAFNGKRRVDRKTFEVVYELAMKGSNVIEAKHNDVVLNISVNEKKDDHVSISWIYSRPSRGISDPLHRPTRANEDAQKIPEEVFQEVTALGIIQPPFANMFNEEGMRNDRVLHWLMRTTSAPLPDLQDLLAKTGVCLMGDVVHAEPIIGGNGANAAILDALTLAEAIASGEESGISSWYDDRYPAWQQGAEECRRNIAEIHGLSIGMSASL
jgi:tyrosinase